MASNSKRMDSPDTRKRSGAQSSEFKPKTTGETVPRNGRLSDPGRSHEGPQRVGYTGADVGGTMRFKPKMGADGPDGSGNGTTHAAAQRPPKDKGGSSGPTRPRSKANGHTVGV